MSLRRGTPNLIGYRVLSIWSLAEQRSMNWISKILLIRNNHNSICEKAVMPNWVKSLGDVNWYCYLKNHILYCKCGLKNYKHFEFV
jgi:hypothetical protein